MVISSSVTNKMFPVLTLLVNGLLFIALLVNRLLILVLLVNPLIDEQARTNK